MFAWAGLTTVYGPGLFCFMLALINSKDALAAWSKSYMNHYLIWIIMRFCFIFNGRQGSIM